MIRALPVAFGAMLWGTVSAAQVTSLCRPASETTVFSCPIASKQIISVCMSTNKDDSRKGLVYRAGKPGRIELEYPPAADSRTSAFEYANHRLGPKDLVLNLRFVSNAVHYTVYSRLSVYTKDEASGVAIKNSNGAVTKLACDTRKWFSDLYALDSLGLPAIPEEEVVEP